MSIRSTTTDSCTPRPHTRAVMTMRRSALAGSTACTVSSPLLTSWQVTVRVALPT